MAIPFSKETELNHQLKCILTDACQIVRADDPQCKSLPGQPRMLFGSDNIYQQLDKEFVTHDLDHLSPYLWLVATQSSSHISPLHEQVLKGRAIVITENPELHLVWTGNRIFIKPIPRYMLSHAFWTTHLKPAEASGQKNVNRPQPSQTLIKAALGFMRTYYYLIEYESDMHIAKQARLLPHDDNNDMTLEAFHQFIASFGDVQDNEVSPRYANYGTLRLSRLNLWAKVFLRRFQFYQVNRQYSEYFARFYGPILFLFGVLTVALSAMQVGLQASDDNKNTQDSHRKHHWAALTSSSLWFSVLTLLCICAIGLIMSSLLGFMLLRELAFAIKDLLVRRRGLGGSVTRC
ncbi:MAG: hypothetical protein Q9178_002667 [Gyalolechia marmorata]